MPAERPRLDLLTDLSPEGERIDSRITPSVARIIASTYDSAMLTNDHVLNTANVDDLREHVINNSSPDLLSYTAINSISTESRKTYWEATPKTFQEQNIEWNNKTWNYLTSITTEDMPNAQITKDALSSLAIDIENTDKTDNLYGQLETFRKDFLGKKSDVEKLISRLADNCKDDRGIVNVSILEQRIDSIKPLFNSFGTTDKIPEILADYAHVYGLLTQLPTDKEQIADAVLPLVTSAITDTEQAYFSILGRQLPHLTPATDEHRRPDPQPDRTMIQQESAPTETTGNDVHPDDRDYDATPNQSESSGRGDSDPTTDENLIDEGSGRDDNDPTTNEALDGDSGGAEEASDDPGGTE